MNKHKDIHYSDSTEEQLAVILSKAGIEFVHESENKEQGLDFYLPAFDVYIEVKRFHADRISKQMASRDNVIAIQGMKSVKMLTQLFQI